MSDMSRIGIVAGLMVCGVLAGEHVAGSEAEIPVPNGSFEDVGTLAVGGVWPEADADPMNANFWLEPGPVSDDMVAFPPELIPPGFTPPQGATLDTGVFYNAQFGQDPSTGALLPNPSFVSNADGSQLAYLFAKDDLEPGLAFAQQLLAVFEPSLAYSLTVAVGKSFFLPPIGGNQGDPRMVVRLFYEDDSGQSHILARTDVPASGVQSTTLADFSATTGLVAPADPWAGRPIGLEILPLDGDSGAWIFDNVRLHAVPEPALSLALLALWLLRGRPCPSRRDS